MSLKTIEERMHDFQPTPSQSFYRRMDRAQWTPSAAVHRRMYAGAGIAIVVFVFLLVFTPQGRALAQQIIGFFATTTEKYFPPSFEPTRTPVPTHSIPISLVIVEPIPAVNMDLCGEMIAPLSSTFPCQLINAEAEAGFEIRSFPADRLKVIFDFLYVDRNLPEVLLSFHADGVFYQINQGLGEFPSSCPEPWCGVAEDAVQAVKVGPYPAEYAAGHWVSQPNSPNAGKWWYSEDPYYRLRWKEGSRWFEISVEQAPKEGMKEKLIDFAENLVSISNGIDTLAGFDTPPVEQQAGYNILEPGLLPKEFQFCGASYHHDDQALSQGYTPYLADFVTVRYCLIKDRRSVADLYIYEMPISIPAELEWMFYALTSRHQEPTTAEEVRIDDLTGKILSNELAQALIWTKEGLKLMMTFTRSSAFGGRLDHTDLTAIAESMK